MILTLIYIRKPYYRIVRVTKVSNDTTKFHVEKLWRLFGLIPLFWKRRLYENHNNYLIFDDFAEAINYIQKITDMYSKVNKKSNKALCELETRKVIFKGKYITPNL